MSTWQIKAVEMAEDFENLSEWEKSLIKLAIRSRKERIKAENEENKAIKTQLLSIFQKSVDETKLTLLVDILYPFLKNKGLKESLLKSEELISLIYAEKERLKEEMTYCRFAIEDIEEMLKEA